MRLQKIIIPASGYSSWKPIANFYCYDESLNNISNDTVTGSSTISTEYTVPSGTVWIVATYKNTTGAKAYYTTPYVRDNEIYNTLNEAVNGEYYYDASLKESITFKGAPISTSYSLGYHKYKVSQIEHKVKKYTRLYKDSELGELTVTENGTYEPSKASGMYGFTKVTVSTPENPVAMTSSNISEIAGDEKYRGMFVSYNGKTYEAVTAGTAGAEELYPSNVNWFLPYVNTHDATAAASDILSGKTAYTSDGKKTGTMTDNSDVEQITVTSPSGNYVPTGYYADIRTQLICQNAQDIVPGNIKKDVTILGVTGTYEGQSYPEYSFSNDGLTISGDNSLFVADGEHNIPLSDAYTVQLDFSWNSGTRAFNIYEQNTDSTDDSDRTLLWSNPSYDASGSASVELKVTKPFLYIAPPPFGNRSYTPSGGVSKVNVIIFKVTGDGGLTVNASCLTGDTLVTMSDYSTKRLDEIRLGDKVLSFDFDSKELIAREVIYTDKDENKSHTEYDKWTFDDGTVIKTVHRHEFYNAEAKRMKYMDEWKMGEHTYKIDGSNPKLIAHERVKETVNHYKITLEGSTNYFANGLLNGDRYCPTNIIPEVK